MTLLFSAELLKQRNSERLGRETEWFIDTVPEIGLHRYLAVAATGFRRHSDETAFAQVALDLPVRKSAP
jgi:hypothetical protein